MTQENDKNQDKTRVYTYDLGGNIISIKEYAFTLDPVTDLEPLNTIRYEYTDTNWKDKLTSYNGQPITYDAIGNPKSYNGYTLGWSNGRELTTLIGNGVEASYTYDANGLRATKTINGIKTTYEYLGDQLLYEKKGSTEIHYLYDSNGSLKGIQTIDGSGAVNNYYVVTNTRGDVSQIYDDAGNLQVSYTYDSWGKNLSIRNGFENEITSDSNIGKLNSLRYRSYYYDDETGLYYLQSRYYDPVVARIINADRIVDTGQGLRGTNMYAYSLNDPVNMYDPKGESAGSFALAGGMALADGPFPFGDIIATVIISYEGYKFIKTIVKKPAKTTKTPIPNKLKEGDKVKTPDNSKDEWTKKGDSYEHKTTKWKGKKDKSGHRGPHWDISPPNGKSGDYYNVSPEGKIL